VFLRQKFAFRLRTLWWECRGNSWRIRVSALQPTKQKGIGQLTGEAGRHGIIYKYQVVWRKTAFEWPSDAARDSVQSESQCSPDCPAAVGMAYVTACCQGVQAFQLEGYAACVDFCDAVEQGTLWNRAPYRTLCACVEWVSIYAIVDDELLLHRVRSGASCLNSQHHLGSVRSSNSCLRRILCLPVTSIPSSIFPSIMCFTHSSYTRCDESI
jgi:hypothetical protein